MSTPHAALSDEDLRLTANAADGTAEAALWWTRVPSLPGERLGVVGGFSSTGRDAARAVLKQAIEKLRSFGCTMAVGPMDGNTWRKYRLVTDAGTEPPFFLEPSNPATWPEWWREAGFLPMAEYYSSVTEDLSLRDERLDAVAVRMAKNGVTIRSFDTARFEEELVRIYDVSVVSFQQNYLYTPLPKEAFLAQYRALRDRVQPALIQIAEHEGKPVGYVFATPDFAQLQRCEPLTTAVLKTLAVLPGRTYAGLGALLLGNIHEQAAKLGFRRVIHALMHETNQSRNLSAHYGKTLRRYTLFFQRLTS